MGVGQPQPHTCLPGQVWSKDTSLPLPSWGWVGSTRNLLVSPPGLPSSRCSEAEKTRGLRGRSLPALCFKVTHDVLVRYPDLATEEVGTKVSRSAPQIPGGGRTTGSPLVNSLFTVSDYGRTPSDTRLPGVRWAALGSAPPGDACPSRWSLCPCGLRFSGAGMPHVLRSSVVDIHALPRSSHV